MYCYKINNSNTIYVCTEYIQDCIKASNGKRSHSGKRVSRTTSNKRQVTPPALNTQVSHKNWGFGTLVEANMRGIMTVAFADRQVKFVYPDAFAKGYLALA